MVSKREGGFKLSSLNIFLACNLYLSGSAKLLSTVLSIDAAKGSASEHLEIRVNFNIEVGRLKVVVETEESCRAKTINEPHTLKTNFSTCGGQ